MQSRVRKILHSEADNEAIQKQLCNDFEVYEYLQQNHLQINNIQLYAKLLNNLVVEQDDRKAKLQQLKATCRLNQEENLQINKSQQHNAPGEILKQMHQRTCKEMEISGNLEREIVETKKSLNLLKGDIGHLVSRNESTRLLFSKVAKVKIVAEDQFKRVALAMVKDKQEIKLRNDMQRKFKGKLKNVSSYENGSLGRIKKNYTEAVLKKQDIYDKLANTQKATQNVEEIMLLKNAKEQKDVQNKELLQQLVNLAGVTKQFSLHNPRNNFKDVNDLINHMLTFHQSQPIIVGDELDSDPLLVDDLSEQILQEYSRLKESIKAQTLHYNELLRIKEELLQKMGEFQKQEADVINKFEIEAMESYKIDDAMKRSYNEKLKKYEQILKVYFALLAYLQKNHYSETIRQRQKSAFLKQNQHLESRRSVIIEDQSPYPTYITQLHKINQVLISETDSLETESILEKKDDYACSFFAHMISDVQIWLEEIKRRLTVDYMNTLMNKTNSSEYRQSQMYNSARNSKDNGNSLDDQQTMNQVEKEEEVNFLRESSQQQPHIQKINSVERGKKEQSVKAKRIKLLQDIDSDYYKMIKSTIKMEKENTRKNYQFTRTFKRTKYSSRDNVLQQKRFQASFSVLFTKPASSQMQRVSRKLQSMYSRSNIINTATGTQNPFNISLVSTIVPAKKEKKSHGSLPLENERKNRLADKLKYALSFSRIN